MDVFADLLVWSAQESGAGDWGQRFRTNANGEKINIEILEVSFDWDVGFRGGIGSGLGHDEWDTRLYYTWFRTRGKDNASAPNGEVTSPYIGNFYVNNSVGSGDGPSYRSASMDWTIRFNMFDWELGRRYCVSSALTLRPFIALKGGWIHQKIRTKWKTPVPSPQIPDPDAFGTAREDLKNNFWGVGPCGGLNTKWQIAAVNCHIFSIVGDFSAAILYGHWNFSDVYKNEVPHKVSLDLPKINGGATTITSFLGFRWDALEIKERIDLSVRLGYEVQFWLDQLQFVTFNTGRLSNGLTLQGGTLHVELHF